MEVSIALYNESRSKIKSATGMPDFTLTAALDEGKTYYLAVYIDSGNATKTGEIPFTISKN